MRHNDLLDRERSLLLVVDIQERLTRAMPDARRLVSRATRLVKAAHAMDVPVLVTEQVPDKLGDTVQEIAGALGDDPRISKSCFSACAVDAVAQRLDEIRADQVVVCGIEAHVCVQQTAFDLLAAGYRPYVAVDAIQSRHEDDQRVALDRMREAGCVLTTSEAVLFEWLKDAKAPAFREVQALVKEPAPVSH